MSDSFQQAVPSSFESYLAQSANALFLALDERDNHTQQHCDRVSILACEIGTACGFSQKELSVLAVGARFHDIGKIGIPDYVLLKPGPLTTAEWEVMKMHPAKGERLFRNTLHPYASEIATVIRHHHERFDGSGYPDGLSGDHIPLASRILGLADIYDAMATTRPYHRARTHREIMDFLLEEDGIRIDPDVFACFSSIIEHSPARVA